MAVNAAEALGFAVTDESKSGTQFLVRFAIRSIARGQDAVAKAIVGTDTDLVGKVGGQMERFEGSSLSLSTVGLSIGSSHEKQPGPDLDRLQLQLPVPIPLPFPAPCKAKGRDGAGSSVAAAKPP